MSNTLLGRKLGMTQVYDGNNRLIPVTVVEAGPCPVVQVKNTGSDGYNAIQIGFAPQKEQRMSRPELGHLKKAKVDPVSHLREVRLEGEPEQQPGDTLTVSIFNEGQTVDVIGTTKGKGFQGVVKRHGMSGGPASHGSMHHRRPGSIGQCQTPGHVYKGRKMPGHMGNIRRTVQNLQVVRVIEDDNLILVSGNVPGSNGDMIVIRHAKKTKQKQSA